MSSLADILDGYGKRVVDLQRDLTSIPALGPKNGGDGEKDKADFLLSYLKSMGVEDIKELNAPDTSVPCGYRPNIAAIIPGENKEKTLWVISHIDVVPPGDLALWNSDPYTLVQEGDTLIGRGVEDNQQGIVSSLLTAQALLESGTVPSFNLGMLFVADEETGSEFGLGYLVNEHEEMFKKDDLFLVPDFGEPNSEMIEIAEKSMFWLKVTVEGKQCHASTPKQGVNTLVPSAEFILRIKDLEEKYDAENPIYDPPHSTFEPTKKEANVENVNTIPGRDVFYVDSRVMPEYNLDDILATISGYGDEIAAKYGVTISYDIEMKEQAAPSTPEDSVIAQAVMKSVKKVYDNKPRLVGVGGGTVAAFLRRKGYEAVVWATLNHNAHQPNEWASVANTVNDAKVFADLLTS